MNEKNCRSDRSACNSCVENDVCCIDTYKIFDSCRDQMCLEDLKIYMTGRAHETLEASNDVRVKMAKVIWLKITPDEMPFNRGYYQVRIRYYFYVLLEGCVNGNPREIPGVAVYDQTTVLCGGESNVSTFKSDVNSTFCSSPLINSGYFSGHQPQIVVDVVDPIVLNLKVVDNCPLKVGCAGATEDMPDQVCACFDGDVIDKADAKSAFISLGVFALIRLQRATQIIVPAGEYRIPDKECNSTASFEDACSLFRAMNFPVEEFFPQEGSGCNSCGCSHSQGGREIDPKDYE
ncbi:MAG: hypothetical protein E7588_01610 [Ruminococcaceae bacterium]|nr:hypothetical protein [Oscillospiraceae bacterium]